MNQPVEKITSLPRIQPRSANAHKGDFGRVLVIAGSKGMSGAAVLCGSAALRGGAGLVTVACPESCWHIIAASNPCLMTWPIPDQQRDLITVLNDAMSTCDTMVIGPGLTKSERIKQFVNEIVLTCPLPIVLDADALNVLDCSPSVLGHCAGQRVLTPHPGEFARLIGLTAAEVQSQREELTIDFARKFGVVLVLKGHGTLICDGNRLYRNTTGNPGMATGGSGDVLAGLIGALVGQGIEPFQAAQLGVHLHGLAGDLARDRIGETSLIASDLLDYLPMAFQTL